MNRPDAAKVKQAVSLLDVVRGDGHVLRRCGAKLWMLCPFHMEKSASCLVDERRFHCFGCGADGDLFDYIQLSDGCDFREAFLKASQMAGMAHATASIPSIQPMPSMQTAGPWKPYRMSDDELRRCVAMADALLRDRRALKAFALPRKWQVGTIRSLALDACLGLHEGRLVYLYPTGAKKRFKPLRPALEAAHTGPKFAWMFGRQDLPWLADRITPSTHTVHITEGETVAITLIEVGLDNGSTQAAIAVPGASAWRDEWAVMFRHRRVVIWPDSDEAGEKLKERIIESVAPYADEIHVVNMPGEETP